MRLAALFLIAISLFAQTTTTAPAPALPASTIANLPSTLVGAGFEWNRYAAGSARFDADVSAAFQIGKSSWYSYTTISTPMEKTPAGQVASTSAVRSGFFYVIAGNSAGSAYLVALAQAGVNVTANAGAATASITGGLGVPVRIGKSNFFVTPLLRFESPTSNGSGVDVVPEVWVSYGFGGAK